MKTNTNHILLGLLLGVSLLTLSTCAYGRDPAQVRHFRSTHPCPATNSTKGACPGYVVDHIIPLCLGGLDSPTNMQWQDSASALTKDKLEWAACRASKTRCSH